MEDIQAWESRHGRIPDGAFVAMRTDWYKRFPDAEKFFNKDEKGQSHYPGWNRQVLQFLFVERGVKAIGHEPVDADAAVTQKGEFFSCESYVLETNRFQIELLANHPDTAELFAPLAGRCALAVAPRGPFDEAAIQVFLLDRPVCVAAGVWHGSFALSETGTVLIAENLEVASEAAPLSRPIGAVLA